MRDGRVSTPPVPGPPPAAPGPAAVGEALAPLSDLEDRPVHEHVEVFDEVHRRLQAQLARLDGA